MSNHCWKIVLSFLNDPPLWPHFYNSPPNFWSPHPNLYTPPPTPICSPLPTPCWEVATTLSWCKTYQLDALSVIRLLWTQNMKWKGEQSLSPWCMIFASYQANNLKSKASINLPQVLRYWWEKKEAKAKVIKFWFDYILLCCMLYKHRKNCECCPGHYLSTSVY